MFALFKLFFENVRIIVTYVHFMLPLSINQLGPLRVEPIATFSLGLSVNVRHIHRTRWEVQPGRPRWKRTSLRRTVCVMYVESWFPARLPCS